MRVGGRIDTATVLGQEGAFGDDVQSREEGQALVEHIAHDVTVPRSAEQLQRQKRTHRLGRRHHVGPGELRLAQQALQAQAGQERREQEQAAEARAEGPRRQVQFAHIGDGRPLGAMAGGPFFIAAPGQLGEAFPLQDQRHPGRSHALAFALEHGTDVIDREVLFAQRHDVVMQRPSGDSSARAANRLDEEAAAGILAEPAGHDAEAAVDSGVTPNYVENRCSVHVPAAEE